MNKKVLIVEDEFVEAHDLQLILEKAGYVVCAIARSVPVAREIIAKENPGIVLLDIFLKGKETGIDLARELQKQQVAFLYISANSNEEILNAAKITQPYGFLVKPFREKDLLIMLGIAAYRHEHTTHLKGPRGGALYEQLTAIIKSDESREQQLLACCKIMQQQVPFDYFTAGFNTISGSSDVAMSFLRVGFEEYQVIDIPGLITISGVSAKELVALKEEGTLYQMLSDTFHMRSCISFPVKLQDGSVFTFSFYSRKEGAYDTTRADGSDQLEKSFAAMSEHFFSKKETGYPVTVNNPFALRQQLPTDQFEGIIGNNHRLLTVFDHITQVAPFDTAVLILGESGTGKERIAQSIHNLSPRKAKPLVKVNCAALPASLIESELFGHEKGSFTGATEKRIGKFGQADGGTIFLDEIGEMPVDLQVKLLRVLQEKEIEPIGSRATHRIDVRIIAATNLNLEKEVAAGRFRLDLYYRLNVFPLELPPLRERKDDIPLLAHHFIRQYSKKTGKQITGINERALESLVNYHWPGNIRELENVMERTVLLAKGESIEAVALPASQEKDLQPQTTARQVKTIHENEHDHIVSVLKKCNGRIWGVDGAAAVLKIPPTTLRSKMKKLGIQKENMQ